MLLHDNAIKQTFCMYLRKNQCILNTDLYNDYFGWRAIHGDAICPYNWENILEDFFFKFLIFLISNNISHFLCIAKDKNKTKSLMQL